MNHEKMALAARLFGDVQMAHVRGEIEMHHAPSLEQTLENYRRGFAEYSASSVAGKCQERARRFMQAEVPAVADIMTECYDTDRQRMLANLEARPELLSRMPLITDFVRRSDQSESA